jgi:hypothetical protein
MWDMRIHVQCHGHSTEVIMSDLESTELFVEELVGLLLQEVFDVVVINGVTIYRVPTGTLADTTLPD